MTDSCERGQPFTPWPDISFSLHWWVTYHLSESSEGAAFIIDSPGIPNSLPVQRKEEQLPEAERWQQDLSMGRLPGEALNAQFNPQF